MPRLTKIYTRKGDDGTTGLGGGQRVAKDSPRVAAFGYIDAHFKQPYRLTLKDPKSLEAALPDKPDAYRRLDTAALEALILRGPAGLSEDDISHLNGLAYSKDTADALAAVNDGRADAAFIMHGTPIDQVREVANAGETMPPKSTFFYPKIPTGLLVNPLE